MACFKHISTLLFLSFCVVSCSGGGGGSDSAQSGAVRGVSCFHAALDSAPLVCQRVGEESSLGLVSFSSRSNAVRFDPEFPIVRFGGSQVELSQDSEQGSTTLVFWGSEETQYQVTELRSGEAASSRALVKFRVLNTVVLGSAPVSFRLSDGSTAPQSLAAGEQSAYQELDPLNAEVLFGGSYAGRVSLIGYEGRLLTIVIAGEGDLFTLSRIVEESPL